MGTPTGSAARFLSVSDDVESIFGSAAVKHKEDRPGGGRGPAASLLPPFMLSVLLGEEEMLHEGRQQAKKVVLSHRQNRLICSVLHVFNHKHGFVQETSSGWPTQSWGGLLCSCPSLTDHIPAYLALLRVKNAYKTTSVACSNIIRRNILLVSHFIHVHSDTVANVHIVYKSHCVHKGVCYIPRQLFRLVFPTVTIPISRCATLNSSILVRSAFRTVQTLALFGTCVWFKISNGKTRYLNDLNN